MFVSWSGDRSKAVAQLLSDWLPQVIQAAEPFISTAIDKGRRWNGEIAERLGTAPVGIICVTRDNLRSPWLLFEAGAISKPRDGYVCTFLLDLEPADVEPPLGDFQHTRVQKTDVFGLVQTINKALAVKGEKSLPDGVLHRVFERNWPELELALEQLRELGPSGSDRPRSDRDLLDEILSIVRRTGGGGEMWREASFIERVAEFPESFEIVNTRPNAAFVYTLRVGALEAGQIISLITSIERLDGFVTAHTSHTSAGSEIECVFLRSAESDVANAMRSVGLDGRVAISRSVSWEPPAPEPPVARRAPSKKRAQRSAPKKGRPGTGA